MWYWHKDGYIDQWDGIQSPEIKPYVCGQLVFKQGRHNHSMGKEKSFQQIVLGQLNIHMGKSKVGLLLHTIYKN